MKRISSAAFITRTGILLGLALIFQIGFRAFAQPLVGPLVNFVLLFSAITVGTTSGIIIGIITPLIAFFAGITPLMPVVPFIMLGNASLVISFNYVRKRLSWYPEYIGVVVAALVKFAVLAFSVRYLVILFVPRVPPALIAALSLPQLYTALIGGILAIVLSKMVYRALRHDGVNS